MPSWTSLIRHISATIQTKVAGTPTKYVTSSPTPLLLTILLIKLQVSTKHDVRVHLLTSPSFNTLTIFFGFAEYMLSVLS